jgi:sugar/nucleoside kinase (ribokinase family)
MKGLFWGLLTIDLHFFTDHYPNENSKVKARNFTSYIGGPATNAAITFRHLGAQTQLTTSVGINAFRAMVFDELRHYGVDIYDLKSSERAEPVFASIITNESNGTRTIFSYHPKETVRQPVKIIDPDADIALFDGFYMKSAIAAAKRCRELGIVTVFDGGSWKSGAEELLKYIDIAICSTDFLPSGITNVDEVTEYLLKKGVQKTAITRGEKPIITNEGEVNFLVEVPKTDAVDSLGAGDIFHGAFCFFYAKTGNFSLSLEKASQIASFSCQFAGPRTWMERD